jgi:uncharacterized protein
MASENVKEADLKRILREAKTIAVVGLSANPTRESHMVASYLKARGYRIIPVNPVAEEILGEKSYPNLESIPESVDVVDVFRRPEHVPEIANQAVKIGAKVLWMQVGVTNEDAARTAREGGLEVVQDRCMMADHSRLMAAAA